MKRFSKFIQESSSIDEAAPKMKHSIDPLKKAREKDRAHDAAMGRTPTGRKKTMTSTQRSLASMRKEEAELDEASDLRVTKVYNKFPKKATYAVHSPDRKYYKEFDTEAEAKKHLETKK